MEFAVVYWKIKKSTDQRFGPYVLTINGFPDDPEGNKAEAAIGAEIDLDTYDFEISRIEEET